MQRIIIHCAKLNNQAACLVQKNRFAKASRLLASALETAKKAQEFEPICMSETNMLVEGDSHLCDASAQSQSFPSPATTPDGCDSSCPMEQDGINSHGEQHSACVRNDTVTQEELHELNMTACEDYDFGFDDDAENDISMACTSTSSSSSAGQPSSSLSSLSPSSRHQPASPSALTGSKIAPAATTAAYVYRRPMRLSIHDLQGSQHEVFSTLSFVVMFNLAISYHLMALEGNDGSGIHTSNDRAVAQKRMRSAVKLYELTFQVQGQGLVPHAIVTSAILNNLALTHRALGNHDKFEACSEMLLSAVLLLVDLGVSSAATTSTGMPASDDVRNAAMVDGFLGNVMHLIVKDLHVASAA